MRRTILLVIMLAGCWGGGTKAKTAVGTAPPAAPPREVKVDTSDEAFAALFLDQADFGADLRMIQDTRTSGPDPGDTPYAANQGVHSGFAVWMAKSDAAIWRVVDIRTVFPDAEKAQRYLDESLGKASEGQPVVSGAPTVGASCHVHGGTVPLPGGGDMKMTMYFYIFRVGNVHVKLFAAQSPKIAPGSLKPPDMVPLAEKIRARIERIAAQGAPDAQE